MARAPSTWTASWHRREEEQLFVLPADQRAAAKIEAR